MKITLTITSRSNSEDRENFALKFASIQDEIRKDPYRTGLTGVSLGKRYLNDSISFPSEFWILETPDSSSLGRISAYPSLYYPNTGYIGLFEASDFPAAKELIERAVSWLKIQGVHQVYGPISYNTWFPYRFRIHLDSSQTFPFEPVNPPEYPLWLREMGFEIAENYHTDCFDGIDLLINGTAQNYENAIKMGFSFRPFNIESADMRDVQLIHQISMISFRKNFLFEPLPYEIFKDLYIPQLAYADLKYSSFVCCPDGREIGYFFLFPYEDYLVLKTAAILPEYRGLGLSNAMVHLAARSAVKNGIHKTLSALVRTGIQSESYGRKQNFLWRHEFALFGKALS
jgi:GNAT superfamily N-acetyltransferase